jgi:hypothetical protein
MAKRIPLKEMVNLLCEFGVWESVLVYVMGMFFIILWVLCVKECFEFV